MELRPNYHALVLCTEIGYLPQEVSELFRRHERAENGRNRDIDVDTLIRLRREGRTITQIAEETGVARSTVGKYVRGV